MGTPANAAQALAQAQQQNALARQIIQSQAVEMTTNIFNTTVNPANNPIVNVPVRNVGLIKGFIIEVAATIHNGLAGPITPSDFGPANILSQITFTDLNNNNRVQTTGWHLEFINTVKSRRVFGSAAPFTTGCDSPINYGSNWQVINSAPTIAASANGTLVMKYWLPIAYSDTDYRGCIWANVINATMQLQLVINANCVGITGSDTTNSCYVGTGAGTANCTSATVTVYQVFMDQVPQSGGAPILPALDLSTVYELKNTNFASVTPNQDFPLQYSNFRQYLSTITVFYNGSSRGTGADVAYWSLQSANYTNIWKKDPSLIAMQTRNIIGADMPPGVYYFSSRGRPISTNQYGNMQLILNALTATAAAYINVGYEDFALVNTIQQAGSLAAS